MLCFYVVIHKKFSTQIERLIQGSGPHGCQQMLIHTAAKHIKEHHLWFSIFFKSHRSRYTRVQRTATAFALLFLSMLVDAMWYGVVPEKHAEDGIELSFIKFTLEQAYIGCMVALVTILPIVMIMIFFKNSKMYKLRPNRIDKALEGKEAKVPGEILIPF